MDVAGMMGSMVDFLAAIPRAIEEADRFALILITVLATGVGVGAVTRNDELAPVAKILVAALLMAMVFGVGLLIVHFLPVFVEMGRMARGAGS